MTSADRLMSLGMPSALAVEVARLLNQATGGGADGGSSGLPTGSQSQVMGFGSDGKAKAILFGPENWTDPESGIPTTGKHVAAYFPNPDDGVSAMRFISIEALTALVIEAMNNHANS